MNHPIVSPKKLIEVALPLDAINEACVKDKNPFLKAHPRAIHLWWARRPLAAARAVIFAQMVNDPSWKWELEHRGEVPPNHLKATWAKQRKRLFGILEDLVLWENTTNEELLEKARHEIRKSWLETCELNSQHPLAAEIFNPDNLPGLLDPFAGGGAIPLEAQRLGLLAFASDLNPVPVLINKAMLEFPAENARVSPVNPDAHKTAKLLHQECHNAEGLAEDIRYYGKWICEQLENRVGNAYPKLLVSERLAKGRLSLSAYEGKRLNVVAWLWARTVKSPNPAYSHCDVPLLSTFVLSKKAGKESYLEPLISGDTYQFKVRDGKIPSDLPEGTKLGRGCKFRCLLSDTAIPEEYVKAESAAGRMGARLIAMVAEGNRRKLYLEATDEHEAAASSIDVEGLITPLHVPIANEPRALWCLGYGITHFDQLYSRRQLFALSTISDLIREARDQVYTESVKYRDSDSSERYANCIAAYLACGLSQLARYSCVNCSWNVTNENVVQAFGRQGIPMTWDYAESHPFEGSLSIATTIQWVADAIASLCPKAKGNVLNKDARTVWPNLKNVVVSTDPPYYDNIGYADLSDFFYVWLRRSLRSYFPELFSTISVPKMDELIAAAHRHGGKDKAEEFFLDGMKAAMKYLATLSHPAYPLTIYYAFRQSETKAEVGTSSTGWETFLEAVTQAGLEIHGTWPMRTEKVDAYKKIVNALASSIILVCRRRVSEATTTSRRAFVRELNQILPVALDEMTRGSGDEKSHIAPVDLSQAIIGPGMAVFSKYAAVLEADGTPMSVKTALQLINRFLAEDDFDADTQFCLHWFEQYGWENGKFGEADVLARSKGTSVDGVKQAGVIHASGGNVRLLKWAEYSRDWDPESDQRLPIWEVLHQLIRVFNTDGETGAANVFAAVQSRAEAARQLAYRLYTLCERKNWAEDARAYNEVVTSWSGIEIAATKETSLIQRELFDN